ncbi:DUF1127 domain-containing protein [Maribius pontilimi]|uniref:DUF1127 domain-containing protein n=1 Tax=Palleronia pontilimi TaxID=1964209 RepID=A0A934MCI5_9RHOB|nr:DUF1127 domain-containing protein [Palleronia pontilimi]MBJ3761296.1 DUF1127 domain-containing protein [Palleronia pontilimi]
MALYDLHRSHAEPLSTRLAHSAVNLVIRAIDAVNARATEKALARLSDHELLDIGLTRSDVGRIAKRR